MTRLVGPCRRTKSAISGNKRLRRSIKKMGQWVPLWVPLS